MLASIGNDYFVTDRSWKCSAVYYNDWMLPSYNDSSWPDAVIAMQPRSPNPVRPLGISPNALNIWTANFIGSVDSPVYCRGHLRTLI